MVMPAFNPRYALAAPSIPVITMPSKTALKVNSFISRVGGT